MQGRRILVVGASSGIGRSTAILAAGRGAKVAIAARSADRLAEVVGQAGGDMMAFAGDVTNDEDFSLVLHAALSWLGGLDILVYATGAAALSHVEHASFDEWQGMFATNVTGAAMTCSRCIPDLLTSSEAGTVALLSSHSVGRPWPGLVPYAASKAALNELSRGLVEEHPRLRVLRFIIGNTATDFAHGWDPAEVDAALSAWLERGYLRHEILNVDEVAERIVDALSMELPAGKVVDLEIIGEEIPSQAP